VAERARRDSERLVSPKLAPDGSGAGAIQLAADPERGSPDHLEREHAPGRAVELDRDVVASLASQRRYAWHYFVAISSRSAFSFADASLAAEASGRSRAEAICSGPSVAWTRVRIWFVTSGCSRRKAVAF